MPELDALVKQSATVTDGAEGAALQEPALNITHADRDVIIKPGLSLRGLGFRLFKGWICEHA